MGSSVRDKILKFLVTEGIDRDEVIKPIPGWENEYVTHAGTTDMVIDGVPFYIVTWNLKKPVGKHPKGDTISSETAKKLGIPIPEEPKS